MNLDCEISACEDTLRNSYLFPASSRYSAIADCLYCYCRRPQSVAKGGGVSQLVGKIKELNEAYRLSIAHLLDLGEKKAVEHLRGQQQRDIAWLKAELLERTGFDELVEEIDILNTGPLNKGDNRNRSSRRPTPARRLTERAKGQQPDKANILDAYLASHQGLQ
jgi:hypothetical protein